MINIWDALFAHLEITSCQNQIFEYTIKNQNTEEEYMKIVKITMVIVILFLFYSNVYAGCKTGILVSEPGDCIQLDKNKNYNLYVYTTPVKDKDPIYREEPAPHKLLRIEVEYSKSFIRKLRSAKLHFLHRTAVEPYGIAGFFKIDCENSLRSVKYPATVLDIKMRPFDTVLAHNYRDHGFELSDLSENWKPFGSKLADIISKYKICTTGE